MRRMLVDETHEAYMASTTRVTCNVISLLLASDFAPQSRGLNRFKAVDVTR